MRTIPKTDRKAALTEYVVLAGYTLLIIFFAAIFVRYSLGPYRSLFNSDDAANVLFGREMIAQRSIFPQWNNATGLVFPLIWPNILVMPIMLGLISDWFTAYRFAVFIDQAIMLSLLWWVLGRVGLSRVGRLFLIALLLIGPSQTFAQQTTLLANFGTGWLFTYTLVLACLAWRVIESEPPRLRRAALLLSGIGALVFVDIATVANIFPGLCIGLAALWASETDNRSRRAYVTAIMSLIAACVLGQLLARVLSANSTYTLYMARFTDLSEFPNHVSLLVRGVLELFGAVPAPGTLPNSVSAAASGAKFVLLMPIFVVPVYLTLHRGILQSRFARLLAVVFAVSMAIRLYIYLFTGISMGITGTTRYFIVEILLGVVVCLFYVEQRLREPWLRDALLLALITPFVLTAPLAANVVLPLSKDQMLVNELTAHGLHLGYASFWNANAPTALSSGAVTIRPVDLKGGAIVPKRWLSSDRWYAGDPNASQSFLLLSAPELKTGDFSIFNETVGEPDRSVTIGDFTALVYPFDIADRLGWSHAMKHALNGAQMRAEVSSAAGPRVDLGRRQLITRWHVKNLGSAYLSSDGTLPVNLGLHLLGPAGGMKNADLAHHRIPLIAPGQSVDIGVSVPLDRLGGGTQIEADLVQESVAWFADRGNKTARVSIPLIGQIAAPDQPAANDEPNASVPVAARKATATHPARKTDIRSEHP